MKRKIDLLGWATIVIFSSISVYITIYAFSNPHLTRTEIALNNLWLIPVLICGSIIAMRNKKDIPITDINELNYSPRQKINKFISNAEMDIMMSEVSQSISSENKNMEKYLYREGVYIGLRVGYNFAYNRYSNEGIYNMLERSAGRNSRLREFNRELLELCSKYNCSIAYNEFFNLRLIDNTIRRKK